MPAGVVTGVEKQGIKFLVDIVRGEIRHGRYPFFRTRFVFKPKFLSKVL